MQKMQKCKKLKSTQKCKLKNKIGHQLLVQKSQLGRGFRDFRPCYISFTLNIKMLLQLNITYTLTSLILPKLENSIKIQFFHCPSVHLQVLHIQSRTSETIMVI